MATKDFLVAAVVMTTEDGEDGPSLSEMIAIAKGAGAGPIIAVVPRGFTAPAGGRTVHVAPRAPRIAAIRAGLSQLTNTPLQYAILLPRRPLSANAIAMQAMMRAARETPAPMMALAGVPLGDSPIVIGRESWLDMITIGERGLDAVARRRGLFEVQWDSPNAG
ncbi:MAG: hypothetical protein H0W68_14245 [Gemmatimonadaceae bacterium]|nr:hypothetical protein [Gemmatimonadaceae bacterium]